MDPRTQPTPLIDIALLCPAAVGVVAWSAPDPTLTVVVKVTLTLPEDGAARLAEQQEPLSLDEQGALGEPGDLDRASDFAPLKARADVLLAGHAYATSPMHVLSAGFAVDKLRKRFYAVAAEPSAQTPLYPRYLRATPGPEGAPVQVGARAVWTAGAAAIGLVSRDGVPEGAFSRGFDYGLFNVAPPDQQLGLLSPTARLVLEGLVPGGDRRMVRLPGARPRVFSLPPDGVGSARAAEETPLRCDTLWIDAGNERCTLTFRGVLAPAPDGALPTLVIAMDFGSERQSWTTLRAELDRAHWTRAATPESTRARALRGAPPAPRPFARRPQVTLDLSQIAQIRDPATALSGGHTQEIDRRLVDAALPFQHGHVTEAAPPPSAPVAQVRGSLAALHRRPAPTIIDDESSGPPSVTHTAFVLPGAYAPTGVALPFQPAAAPAPVIAPSLPRFPAPEETRLAPEPTRAPEPPQSVDPPTSKEPLLSIEVYAAIKAASWGGRGLEGALRERAIDEIAWYTNERRLAAALAAEAAEGKSKLSRELRRALRKAKAPTSPTAGALPAPEPLRRRVKHERAPRAAKRVVARPLNKD